MVTALTDSTFYDGTYKDAMGECTIPSTAFDKWSIKASNIVRAYTFNNIDETTTISELVQMCVCEVAEHLYSCYQRDNGSDSSIASEKDGSWSVSYKDRKTVEQEDNAKSYNIVRTWLAYTGLLFCGV
ncbi:head-tail connector protein [Anaerosporobacter faecicola]|uniref:hypothetical protein n=1 Tax=Anaerosporobacter faecicola TaxID=2718714 RepID=UPI00143C6101|nr:hypothetical protein [Anaerosporobacter faecicola]